MRSTSFLKPALVVALGCVALFGCGTQNAATGRSPAGGTLVAAPPSDAPPGDEDAELRFLALMTRTAQGCAPDAPDGGGSVPAPEDPPGGEGAPAPRYGPGETPPGVPNAEGEIPVPLADPAPPGPAPESTGPTAVDPVRPAGPVEEVPLTGVEECDGGAHAKRVREAFGNTRTAGHRAMREKLTDLGYPVSRIHRMPDRAGAPRVRLDLRVMDGRLALEVTAAGRGVTVEAFGAPETEDVRVTDVRRKRKPDAPAS
ncbi:hypothetical protein [Streptomyces roseolilacinus]|uniref:hypothetical protein n=1 Tax=Streptomyces roseolilacinus TaxID=66904 RepID=UPI00382CA84B